jgi:hypothetical protein
MARTSCGKKGGFRLFAPRTVTCRLSQKCQRHALKMPNPSEPMWQAPETKSELAIGTLIREAGWPSSRAMTQEPEPLSIRLPLFAVVVAAVCGAVAVTAFVVQSPTRKSAPVGAAARADEPSVAHHRQHPVRTVPIIGRTIPLEAQPAPQSASVTPQEQTQPRPDMAQRSRIERAEASDPVCGERGRRWFTDRPGHRSWRCNR